MNSLWQDLRYSLRMLRQQPSFALIAVLTLALGIGATTALFSVVHTVLLRQLNYRAPEQLVMLWQRSANATNQGGSGRESVSPPNFYDWSSQNQSFDSLAATTAQSYNLTGAGEPERLEGQRVSATLFPLLGVAPLAGRTFTTEEDRAGAARVVVLSHGLWQRRFGADQRLIGQTITLDNESYTVAGVMPPGFYFPDKAAQLWTPTAFTDNERTNRAGLFLDVVARLKPNVPLAQAQAEMDAIAQRLAQAYPDTNTGMGVALAPLNESLVGDVRRTLWILFGAVGFVLLIACANVANLLLARASAREREIALRAALGAERHRIVRQLLTESLVLALLGSTLGLLLAHWGLAFVRAFDPGTIARLDEVSLDARVLIFTLVTAVLTSVLFGLLPAWQAASPNLTVALKEGGRGASGAGSARLRGALVVAEVALALVLLAGAGLLMRSFLGLQRVELGFDPQNLLTLEIELPPAKYAERPQRAAFYQQLIERVQTLPGVQAASVIGYLPLATTGGIAGLTFEDKPDPPPGRPLLANNRVISPAYFRTLGIALLKGRVLSEQDAAEAPLAVIVNQTLARKFFGDEDPVGKRLKAGSRNSQAPWRTIVGVVADIRQTELNAEPMAEFYVPFTQPHASYAKPRFLVVRTSGEPLNLTAAVKNVVWALDKDQPIAAIRTMEQILSTLLAPRRFNLLLLALFAFIALALAGVGIYGVIAFAVSQRQQEIGVRMALGAQRGDVLRLIVGQGMRLVALGVVGGLLASFALTRLLRNLLFGVSGTDLLTFVAVAVLLALVALLACWLPARRAARVDPVVALRGE